MKKIYEAANSVEAHMILNLLEQAGLSGRVDGDYLQGGVGELPAGGFVRVMIDEVDYDQAKDIVRQWDAPSPVESKLQVRQKGSAINAGIIGFIFGVLLMVWFYKTPITHDGIDYNGDGVLDEKWTYVGELAERTELDRNLDGKIDFLYKYGRDGLVVSSSSDENFDGAFETEAYYAKGNLVRSKSDTDSDGFGDYQMDFKNGVIDTITFFDAGTKRPVKVQTFNGIKLVKAEVDTAGDGILDTVFEYDGFENVSSSSKK